MGKRKKRLNKIILYIVIAAVGVVMVYPVIWMFLAAFKTNSEIFGSLKLLPGSWSPDAFIKGWQGTGKYTFGKYFINTFLIVVPTTLFTVGSCALVAYGFARFKFPGKKFLFAVLIATLMLPNTVIIIPRYTLFNKFGWLNTYLPFYVPALLACFPFFIYMLLQFMRGIPRELDESAYIDGCGTFRTFRSILFPLLKPAMFSAGLFQFLWTYNDFFNSLIYINSVDKYPLSLALRTAIDSDANVQWGQIMAMAFVSVLPLIILFFVAQKYFVEGIATSGLKG
ncbi:carbohydrate ABC transporter permease [Murimonas intestini]|uniref:Carbohydrate ABC transporter membrane protein 2 (CUT1 family) n=1 Tax=Murimonas intestini TaxID=1337051 RepID=A0AB73T7C6_9FIRM|nr:carbohydrate ABC transporter permease [Murimonas intestini]MCR1841229.1 carbohydrate ABC transporter permease [Murimonas intestini]MCR1866147.1 carbohydrate ABC transporter permease [Murimonas intestini]MCR1882736.1 carbohydrate ABC transporter permease [Murimonas intestini]